MLNLLFSITSSKNDFTKKQHRHLLDSSLLYKLGNAIIDGDFYVASESI
uniref:Uncharacterized protein n=1 Tax=Arundo donax TaxID=35708 RepID=A0A0A9GLT8_ARUDO